METRSDQNLLKYSEREAEALAGRLVNKETFKEAMQVLIRWLQEGQCDEKNAIQFISLIQLCYDHFEKLKNEAKENLEEAQEARESLEKQNNFLKLKLSEIEDVFKVIDKKNVCSNFTENQMKEIQGMITDIRDFKDVLSGSIVVEEKGSSSTASQGKLDRVYQNDMHIISLLSVFLYDNQDGVNLDSICSYLNQHIPVTCATEIENLMRRFPKIFKESISIGNTQETKWTCISISPGSLSEILLKRN